MRYGWLVALLFGACSDSDPAVDSGDVAVDSDDAAVDSGDAAVDAGDVAGDSGDVAVDSDDVAVDSSDVAKARCELPPGSLVSLPADDARHVAATEWFYWTGHLKAEDGRWFGFHITVVVVGAPGIGAMIGHHSLTRGDPGSGPDYRHGFEAGLEKGIPDDGFAFDLDDLVVSGFDGHDKLRSRLDGATLDLDVVDHRGPVARHGSGFKDYGGGISTYSYARPRMSARGTLDIDGEHLAVTGSVWFDHQWGALAPPDVSRWDWIAIQLEDGRDIMVVQIPTPDGIAGEAELSRPDCSMAYFDADQVGFNGTAFWQSPSSGCTYPMDWQVTVGDEVFDLTPLADDQEMHADPIPYWEGAATVSGSATGRAYVELVGYCH